MYNLYLIRHGESIQNTHENVDNLPDHAIPLSENGIKQAVAAGFFLKNFFAQHKIKKFRVWESPYLRTRQTAEKILECQTGKYDVRSDTMLAEMQFGLFHNLSKDVVGLVYPDEWKSYQNERKFHGKFFARRPNGESPFDVSIRQKLFLETLYRDFRNGKCPEHIMIVGHGAALNVLRMCIFHYSYEWYNTVENPGNCSVQHIVLDPDQSKNYDLGYIYGEAIAD